MNIPTLTTKNSTDLEVYVKSLPQTLVINTPDYLWGGEVSKYIAQQNNMNHEFVYPTKKEKIDLEQGKISVEQIRDLISRSALHTKKGEVYTIYMADTMQAQAQNAFLKALEEPNKNTHFILLVKNKTALLPTVLSRTQLFTINKLPNSQASKLIPDTLDTNIKQQILFIAKGSPTKIAKLIKDPTAIKEHSTSINQAKQIITAKPYQRIVLFNKFKDDRAGALNMLDSLIYILSISAKGNQAQELLLLLDGAIKAHKDLKANFNVRLTLIKHLL